MCRCVYARQVLLVSSWLGGMLAPVSRSSCRDGEGGGGGRGEGGGRTEGHVARVLCDK
jgi:hypothetical protein